MALLDASSFPSGGWRNLRPLDDPCLVCARCLSGGLQFEVFVSMSLVVMCGELGVGRKLDQSLRVDFAALRTAKVHLAQSETARAPFAWPLRPRQRPSARNRRLR